MSTTATACQYSANIFTLNGDMTHCSASTKFLQSIFGQPIDVLTGNASMNAPITSLVTHFLGHFNTLALALIIALFSYVVFHGFLSTVNEGKFGGRDMGHWSYALRAILPGAMLVPVKGGFCAMQFVIMYFILVGVNLANYVWQQSVGDIAFGYTPTTPDAITDALTRDLASDFVAKSVFTIVKNHNYDGTNLKLGNVSLWNSPYSSAAMQKMTEACNNLDPTSPVYTRLCLSDLNLMKKYKVNSVVAPLGGASSGETTAAYPSIKMSLSNGGLINLAGNYTLAKSLQTNSSVYINDAMSALSAPASAVNSSINTPLQCGNATATGSNASNANCSFDNAILKLKSDLISHGPKPTGNLSKVVVGTGETCEATCRSTSTNAPISGIDTQKACIDSNNSKNITNGPVLAQNYWTSQCYVKDSQTNPADKKYDIIPAQLIGNSWWYGSRVYLQLNQAMANNIQNLADKVNNLKLSNNALVKYAKGSAAPKMSFNIQALSSTYIYNGNNEVVQSTSIAPKHNPTADTPFGFINTQAQTNSEQGLNSISWTKLLNCYGNYLPEGETAQMCLKKAMGVSHEQDEITVGGTAANAAGAKYYNTHFPKDLQAELSRIPVQYQNPIKVLMILNLLQDAGKNPITGKTEKPISNTDFIVYINRIIQVLQYNHVYPGSTEANGQTGVSSAGETTPMKNWINLVFNKLMGQNLPGPTNGQAGIFTQIYSLGNTNISSLKNVMSNSFNTMADAQRLGLEMINTVTNALQQTYQNIDAKLQADQVTDTNIAYAGGSNAFTLGLIPFVGGALSSAAATISQTDLQMTMASQMMKIGEDMAWMPIAIMVLTAMFTAGISFAVILPMTPFFLFWAGEIAWVLAVIEAMVAAPLLTLGFTTPGGHQHFGHTVPGLKMLLAVVFRPVLMVLGLLIGMVLTFVIIRFSSQGFQIVANQILHFAGSSANYDTFKDGFGNQSVPLAQGIIACILLFTFTSFMMMAFTKCFSMIYVIPEKVMQWIGGMADKAGQQELEKMTQGMTQNAQQGAQAGGQTTEKAIGAKQQQTQSKGQADGAAIQGSATTGQAGGKAIQSAISAPEGGSPGLAS